jgi:glucose/arabinose dehydrogenase
MTSTLRSPWALVLALGFASVGCGGDDKGDPQCAKGSSECETDDAGVDGTDDDDDDDGDDQMDARVGPGKDAGRDAKANPPVIRDSGKGDDAPPSKSDGSTPPVGSPDGGRPPEPSACDATKAPEVGKLALEAVVTGLEGLTFAAQPPGSSDWYLLQQGGQVRVFSNGALKPGAFLDVGAEVALTSNPIADDERGLLGIAFPDDYESSGLFYIMLTPTSGAGANRDTVREYRRSAADPFVADATPTKTIVQLPSSAFNHNGGNIVFGPDKMLYVGTGDGGASCGTNQRGAAQDPTKLFGKILRLDPKAPAPHGAAGNPFPESPLVLHYGLRNPYRFGFDKDTGDLFIGDVGQDGYEEVDYAPSGAKGLNFGWPTFEGKQMSTGSMGTCSPSALHAGATAVAPIIDMDRRAGASGPFANYNSVIGGYVYRGEALAQLRGVYVFGDYEGTRMGMLRQCGDKTSPVLAIPKKPDPNLPTSFAAKGGAPALGKLTAIVQDNQGELYFVSDFSTLLKIVPGS